MIPYVLCWEGCLLNIGSILSLCIIPFNICQDFNFTFLPEVGPDTMFVVLFYVSNGIPCQDTEYSLQLCHWSSGLVKQLVVFRQFHGT